MIVPLDTPDERGIQEALEKIIASRSFRGSPRLQELLRYVVTETLSGRASTVKAYSIAVDVFGRNPSFDPSTDTIVRVQAGRLRNALVNYYKGEGKNDRIRIEIPRGGYVPVFQSVRADDDAAPHDIDPATLIRLLKIQPIPRSTNPHSDRRVPSTGLSRCRGPVLPSTLGAC